MPWERVFFPGRAFRPTVAPPHNLSFLVRAFLPSAHSSRPHFARAHPACTPTTGACSLIFRLDGTICDDGQACANADRFKAGAWVEGTNICVCSSDAACAGKEDGNACNGAPCTKNDYCLGGKCGVGTFMCACQKNADCRDKDGDLCASAGGCAAGVCKAGGVTNCDAKTGKCNMGLKKAGVGCDTAARHVSLRLCLTRTA